MHRHKRDHRDEGQTKACSHFGKTADRHRSQRFIRQEKDRRLRSPCFVQKGKGGTVMSEIQDKDIKQEELTLQDEDEMIVRERIVMPCIPLRGLIVYPNTILHFDVGREKTIRALEAAMARDKILFVTAQKDENILIPTEDDYYRTGTVIKIKQMLKIQVITFSMIG